MKSSAARKGEPSSLLDANGNAIMSEPLESRVARIESAVEYVKTNTENLVVELRRTNDRIDTTWLRIDGAREMLVTKSDGVRGELGDKIEGVDKKVDGVRQELGEKIEGVRQELGDRIEGVDKKVDGVRQELGEKIEGVREELGDRIERVDKKIDDVRQELSSAKIWAVLLYLTLAAGLLSVIARAFKWI
jgi:chromosome segregation ATPase